MEAKKLYFKIYAWIFAIVFIIVAAVFIIRYPILGLALVEESWLWEIIKYFAGYIVLAIIVGGIAFTPVTMYIQRKTHGLIK